MLARKKVDFSVEIVTFFERKFDRESKKGQMIKIGDQITWGKGSFSPSVI